MLYFLFGQSAVLIILSLGGIKCVVVFVAHFALALSKPIAIESPIHISLEPYSPKIINHSISVGISFFMAVDLPRARQTVCFFSIIGGCSSSSKHTRRRPVSLIRRAFLLALIVIISLTKTENEGITMLSYIWTTINQD